MPDSIQPLPIDPEERQRELGRQRGHRHYRRASKGQIYAQGDIPTDISEWMIKRDFISGDGSADPNEWFNAMVRALRSKINKF